MTVQQEQDMERSDGVRPQGPAWIPSLNQERLQNCQAA